MAKYKIVYGIVSRDGDKLEGKGFTCRRKEQGEYEIKFKKDFDNDPAITATAEHGEEDDRQVLNVVIDRQTRKDRKGNAIILIQTENGNPNDNKFHFIAVAEED